MLKPISESLILKFLTPYEFWVCVNSFLAFIIWPGIAAWVAGSLCAEFKFHKYNSVIEHTRLENIVNYIQADK